MKKILGIFVLFLVLIGIVFLIYRSKETKPQKENAESNLLNEEKIRSVLGENQIENRKKLIATASKSPDQVIALNVLILKMTYGGEIGEKELEDLLLLQREQFSEELLSLNPPKQQLLKVWSSTQKKEKLKIVDYKALAPVPMDKIKYNGVARKSVKVSVVYYTNIASQKQFVDYLLYEDEDKKWKIVGWSEGEEFLVTE